LGSVQIWIDWSAPSRRIITIRLYPDVDRLSGVGGEVQIVDVVLDLSKVLSSLDVACIGSSIGRDDDTEHTILDSTGRFAHPSWSPFGEASIVDKVGCAQSVVFHWDLAADQNREEGSQR